MEDALDVEFLLTDLAVELAKAKEQGYDKVKLWVRHSYDNDIEFELVGYRLETPREVSARLSQEKQALKNRARYALQHEAAALTREEVLAAWEAGQKKKKEG